MTHFTICVAEDQTIDRLDLKLGGSVSYFPNFLSETEHLRLLKHLTSDIHWYEYTGMMVDKVVTYPRLMYNMSDSDGTWTPLVNYVRQRLQKLTQRSFSYAHLGYYKTGDRYLGYHRDVELHDGDIICSVTFGATRRFVIRERYLKSGRIRNSGPPDYEFRLKGGSLFVFDQIAARDGYKHSVPKVRTCDEYHDKYGLGRVNITFRER